MKTDYLFEQNIFYKMETLKLWAITAKITETKTTDN